MGRVTAEVEGAVTGVRFHEGDVGTPQTVLLRIDPERYRLELDRAKAALDQATPELGRARADLKRREELAANQLVAAGGMTRSPGEDERLGAARQGGKGPPRIAQHDFPHAEGQPPHRWGDHTQTV